MSSSQHFGDVVLCPVCLAMYQNRIMQCSQGHSVCEHCYTRLVHCPTCRSIFSGARNYALEDIMTKLHSMYPSDDQPDECEPDSTEHARVPYRDREMNHIGRIMALRRGPVQGAGHYRCRIDSCPAYLPVCRMHNHLRYHHAKQITEHRSSFVDNELQFQENWSLPVRSWSRAIKITKVGLFFIMVDVKEGTVKGSDRSVCAWVEAVCPSKDAQMYRFGCDLVYGQKAASYVDTMYGDNADSKEIKRNGHCLKVFVPAKQNKMLLQVRIYKPIGTRNLTRNSTTTVRSMPTYRHNISQMS